MSKGYLRRLITVYNQGVLVKNRTGIDCLAYSGVNMSFHLNNGETFPLLTTKEMNFHAIKHELCWFLRGDTTIDYLHKHNVHIWDKWVLKDGSVGRIYGSQWRNYRSYNEKTGKIEYIDQLQNCIDLIQSDPTSRRIIVNSWNVGEIHNSLETMALPPCHCFFQFIAIKERLSIHVFQRSGDMFLGVPFNIASYALLLMIVAKQCGLYAHKLSLSVGHAHIYENHIIQVRAQLERCPLKAPSIELDDNVNINDRDICLHKDLADKITLCNYRFHSQLKGAIAV